MQISWAVEELCFCLFLLYMPIFFNSLISLEINVTVNWLLLNHV